QVCLTARRLSGDRAAVAQCDEGQHPVTAAAAQAVSPREWLRTAHKKRRIGELDLDKATAAQAKGDELLQQAPAGLAAVEAEIAGVARTQALAIARGDRPEPIDPELLQEKELAQFHVGQATAALDHLRTEAQGAAGRLNSISAELLQATEAVLSD